MPSTTSAQSLLRRRGWWLALAILVLNDHVLKGAGILPAELTGKISDVAGLLVFPSLVIALLQSSSRRTWGVVHIAVALVFSALQIFPEFAASLCRLASLFGLQWSIWSDPSDLLALPAILWSYWRLVQRSPALAPDSSLAIPRPVSRFRPSIARPAGLHVAGLVLGLAASLGSSWQYSEDSADEMNEVLGNPTAGRIFLHNEGTVTQHVRIYPRRAGLQFDCSVLAADPGSLLRDDAFGPPTFWSMPPRTVVAIDNESEDARCGFAKIDGDRLPPTYLFWNADQYPLTIHPGASDVPLRTPGVVSLQYDNNGDFIGYHHAGQTLVYPPTALDAALQPSCHDDPFVETLAWELPTPRGQGTITAITPGADGCFAIELEHISGIHPTDENDSSDEGASVLPEDDLLQTNSRIYLCVPEAFMSFSVGQDIRFEAHANPNDPSLPNLHVTSLNDGPILSLWRGPALPQIAGIAARKAIDTPCNFRESESCAGPARTVILEFSDALGSFFRVAPGDSAVELQTGIENKIVQLGVFHAKQHSFNHSDCGDGLAGALWHYEVAALEQLPIVSEIP